MPGAEVHLHVVVDVSASNSTVRTTHPANSSIRKPACRSPESVVVGAFGAKLVDGRQRVAEISQPRLGVLADETDAPGKGIGA